MSSTKEPIDFRVLGDDVPRQLREKGIDRLFFVKEGGILIVHEYGRPEFVPYTELSASSAITKDEAMQLISRRGIKLVKQGQSLWLSR